MAQTVVKLTYSGDTRRIVLTAPPSFADLQAAVKAHFKVKPKHSRLVHVDEDGDTVTLYDDASLAAAVAMTAGGATRTLKIEVVELKSGKDAAEDGEVAAPAPAAKAAAPATTPAPAATATAAPAPTAVPFFGLPFFPAPAAAFVPPAAPAVAPPAAAPADLPAGFTLTADELAATRNALHAFIASEPNPLLLHHARARVMAAVGPTVVPFAMARLPLIFQGTAGHRAILADAVRAGIVLPVVEAAFAAYPRLAEVRDTLVAPLLRKCGYPEAAIAADRKSVV